MRVLTIGPGLRRRGARRSGAGRPVAVRRTARRRDERGTATAFVVGIAVAMLAVAGLVVDGGNALNARMKLADDTEQAARAGAQQIDLDALYGSQTVRLDTSLAEQSARAYIGRYDYTVTGVGVNGDAVTVAATDTVDTVLLSLINFDSFTIRATATAEAATQ